MSFGNVDDASKHPVSSLCNLLWEFPLPVICVSTSTHRKAPSLALAWACCGVNLRETEKRRGMFKTPSLFNLHMWNKWAKLLTALLLSWVKQLSFFPLFFPLIGMWWFPKLSVLFLCSLWSIEVLTCLELSMLLCHHRTEMKWMLHSCLSLWAVDFY